MILILVIKFFLQPIIQWLELHPKSFFIHLRLNSFFLVEEKDSRERVNIEHRLQILVFICINLSREYLQNILILILSSGKSTL